MANKNKAELLAEAKELGLEIAEGATNKEIQEAIDNAPTPEPTEEEVAQAKAVEEAKAKEEAEAQAAMDEQKRLEEEAKAAKKGEGSDIASAIREGLAAGKEDKRIKITADKSVRSMFSVVRNKKTGEVMLRENATGTLSKVQLQSLEEKEASIQGQEVEEI